MKIVIPGGSGQVGTLLARAFSREGHEVVVLSRHAPEKNNSPWRVVVWDARVLGNWANEFEGANVVINMAGRSVNCRYNAENRRLILDSRVESTRIVAKAIERAQQPPPLWLQASGTALYSHRYDAPNDELTGLVAGNEPDVPQSWQFSVEVNQAWEAAADELMLPQTRVVKMRTALVMTPSRGGVFDVMLGLARHGLGGAVVGGRQYLSWIHGDDFVRAVKWIIEHEELEGAINICAPNPLPQAQFMQALRAAWGIKFGLPISRWMLEIGAYFMRTETELVLKSRRVVPTRLLQSGFEFQFPAWPEAARDLCYRWREIQKTGDTRE